MDFNHSGAFPPLIQTIMNTARLAKMTSFDIQEAFPLTTLNIEATHYDIYVFGFRNNRKDCKECACVRLLACENNPFVGRHRVLYNGKIYLTNSLSRFKETELKFTDKVQFVHASFLYAPNPNPNNLSKGYAIRLAYIRDRITLPLLNVPCWVKLNSQNQIMNLQNSNLLAASTYIEELYDHVENNSYGLSKLEVWMEIQAYMSKVLEQKREQFEKELLEDPLQEYINFQPENLTQDFCRENSNNSYYSEELTEIEFDFS